MNNTDMFGDTSFLERGPTEPPDEYSKRISHTTDERVRAFIEENSDTDMPVWLKDTLIHVCVTQVLGMVTSNTVIASLSEARMRLSMLESVVEELHLALGAVGSQLAGNLRLD